MATKAFSHPYQPYDIQIQFMEALYSCIEERKVGIFESPTGTGKSLSLICGSLTWLRDHKRKALDEQEVAAAENDDEPEWMVEFAKKERRQNLQSQRVELEKRLSKIRAKEAKEKKAYQDGAELPLRKRHKVGSDQSDGKPADDEQYVLDDYQSDEEKGLKSTKDSRDPFDGLSAETLALLGKLGSTAEKPPEEDEIDDELKIFYCSRTHSQIMQFVTELRRVHLPSTLDQENMPEDVEKTHVPTETLKHLSLGSRKNLCINPKVSSLGSIASINERCLELQQPQTSTEQKCPFIPGIENQTLVNGFRDYAIAKIRDIEDLGKLGKTLGICPYYASRSAVKPSEIVTLPYQLLLQKSAREALSISLKDHIIIIDEAHNLMDAIANVNSITLSLTHLQSSLAKLTTYAQKFKNRLKGKNRAYVAQLVRLVSSVIEGLQKSSSATTQKDGIIAMETLMAGKGVDQINPHKLSRFLHESKLARKVEGFTSQQDSELEKGSDHALGGTPVLLHVQNFLLTLMNPSDEGRMFFSKQGNELHLRYALLDPTNHFRGLVEDARSVILAGGTMSPMSDYALHLFPYLLQERLQTFSYGHVIPPENLIAMTISQSASATPFDFTFKNRTSEKLILSLGETLLTIAQHTPDGLVVFFPSYDYLSTVLQTWQIPQKGTGTQTIYSRLTATKPIFAESKTPSPSSTAAPPTDILTLYTTAIATSTAAATHTGALLISVIGGKLSEGINFSDALGRAVVVVGLPYPNIHTAEWKAKIEHIEAKRYSKYLEHLLTPSSTTSTTSNPSTPTPSPQQISQAKAAAKAASSTYIENLTMRAVNQCIGRAIRHRNDYAAIVLIDQRYEGPRIRDKLPGWIKGSVVGTTDAREVGSVVGGFFRGR